MSAAQITARVESTVQYYKLQASIDFRLTESLVDRDGVRSQKAIAGENMINFPTKTAYIVFLRRVIQLPVNL